MNFALGPGPAAAGYRLLAFDSIGSTNSEALALAAGGESGPLWLVTDHQTSGRGRRGRAWVSPRGNLAATLLLSLHCTAEQAASLGFVAGLALDSGLRGIAPELDLDIALDAAHGEIAGGPARLRLKWPNDLVTYRGKLAGILLEVQPNPDGRLAIAVGIGVNVTDTPVGLPYPATSLTDLGVPARAQDVFTALSNAWIEFADLWDEGRGFVAIRRLWLARAAGLGAPVAVHTGQSVVRGIFETLDGLGRLVIRQEDGSAVEITAGDVHFGVAATSRVS